MYQQTNVPDIWQYNDVNPTWHSPNSPFEISFAQTRESLMDIEVFKAFLDNAIARFRHSRTYKHYKAHLMEMGLNRCQFQGNIKSDIDQEMATIEMHHNILTIFDVALIITEHMLNVQGAITTFDLVELLKMEHINHRVCTVMLSKTAHQLVHSDPNFVVPPSMCFGNWPEFLRLYHTGITRDICFKLLYYIKKVVDKKEESLENTTKLLQLRNDIVNWAEWNERGILTTN
jgi:hypothetical protein